MSNLLSIVTKQFSWSTLLWKKATCSLLFLGVNIGFIWHFVPSVVLGTPTFLANEWIFFLSLNSTALTRLWSSLKDMHRGDPAPFLCASVALRSEFKVSRMLSLIFSRHQQYITKKHLMGSGSAWLSDMLHWAYPCWGCSTCRAPMRLWSEPLLVCVIFCRLTMFFPFSQICWWCLWDFLSTKRLVTFMVHVRHFFCGSCQNFDNFGTVPLL